MITVLNLTQSWPELNLSLSHSLLSHKNTVQLYCSGGNKITLHGQKSVLRWKNSLVSVCDERTLWSNEHRARDKCMSCFSRGITGAKSQDKQTGLWELGRENHLFNPSLLLSHSGHFFSCSISPKLRGNIVSLGVSGKRKRADVIHFQMAVCGKRRGKGPLDSYKTPTSFKG